MEESESSSVDITLEATTKELEEPSIDSDSKLRHNRAVVKFYQSDCKDYETLLQALNEEISSTNGASQGHHAMARYNKATIYYHRRMYYTAIETLEPLIDNLDSLEESTIALVGLLMLRLLLATNNLRKALAFLEFFELKLSGSSLLTTNENSAAASAESDSRLEGFGQTFKFLSMLTKMLNRKLVVIPDDKSVEFAALKAYQYYIMKDFQMAAKQLKNINIEDNTESIRCEELKTCIANNMGVIHLRVRHYAIAAKFFQNAISFDKQVAANIRNVGLYYMSAARSCEILYNLGIAMLHLRRPKEAFQCLLVPLKSYHSNPRLWFRMAEACIMDHEMKLLEEDNKPIISTECTVNSRKMYILKPTPMVIYSQSGQSAAVPEPNLEFAALSLRNALTLTNFYRSEFHVPIEDGSDSEEADSKNWRNVKDNNFCNPSKPISKESLDNMLDAIYAAYSYVSLRLGDYVVALEMAQELLKSEKLSGAHKMLAHIYAGEALIMMDNLTEAKSHFEPSFISSLNSFDFETKEWQVKSLDAAQNVVRYNLAVAMVLQGDYDMAKSLLTTCTHPIVAAKMKSLKVYLDIKLSSGP